MKKTYKFYSDSGHGWLAVKRQELIDLGIINDISAYSYEKGKTVYLEEDCDTIKFINAKGWSKDEFNANVIEKYHNGNSQIRSYARFQTKL